MSKIPDDVVENALNVILEIKKYKRDDLTLGEYEFAMNELRAVGDVFVEGALEEAAKRLDGSSASYSFPIIAAEIRALKPKQDAQ